MQPKIQPYVVGVRWEGNRGAGTAGYAAYDRRFRVSVEGKPDLAGSADPAFRGDPDRHNPEELVVAAVASCHMLFYLALCARAGVTVVEYADAAVGTVSLQPEGGGRFEEVLLRPRVTVARGTDLEAATALHERAAALCFVANSCRFPVRHQPQTRTE